MKRLVATFFFSFIAIVTSTSISGLEINTSYDYFRGMPDGSWNGNNGMLISANDCFPVCGCLDFQIGGSYGFYNWDGRANLVFANPKKLEQMGFLTAGLSSSFCDWNVGLVYDRLFTKNFGIYAVDPDIDQLRWQLGYMLCCCDEVGFWGTVGLNKAHESALGIPTSFKAIGQMNLFWRHQFDDCATTTLWIGIPYQDSLMFPGQRAGNVIAGFSFRVPLAEKLFLDGNGSYMEARKSSGATQSRNYGANMCLGITYCFNGYDGCCNSSYMNMANHSNFFVDTNVNQ